MKLLKLLVLVLLCTSLFTSCEEDFVLHRKEFTPSVVVNSVFTVNKPWEVNLSFSRDILENGSKLTFIDNADVVVIEVLTGRRTHLSYVGDGNYTSEFYKAQQEKYYELEVHVPGYDVITARSRCPRFSEVVISDVIESTVDKTTQVAFQIHDNSSNFYIWNLVVSNGVRPIDTIYRGGPKELIYSIHGYNQIAGLTSHFTTPINDAASVGGDFMTKHIDFNNNSNDTTQLQSKRYLRLITASKDLYTYYKSVDKYNNIGIGSSITPSADIFSNIKGGLGIFAGFSEKYHEITE